MSAVIVVGDLETAHGNYGSTRVLMGSSTIFLKEELLREKVIF